MKKQKEISIDLFCSKEELRIKLNEQKRLQEQIEKEKQYVKEFNLKYPTFEVYHKECISIDFYDIIPKWTNECRDFWESKRSVYEFHHHFLELPFD